MNKAELYYEPIRHPWTADEMRAAVGCIRAMIADEAKGRDPHRKERLEALATELGRERTTVRMRLGNIVHVLTQAGLPVPAGLPDLKCVGRRTAAVILDAWDALEAEGRRPWTDAELAEAVTVYRRIIAREKELGRSLLPSEACDAVSEAASLLKRRWSEARRVLAAVAACAQNACGQVPSFFQEEAVASLGKTERNALELMLKD